MKRKIRPSIEINNKIKEMVKSERIEVFREFLKTGMEKLIQEALEGEVTEFLGRDWYKRSDEQEKFKGYRNGYYPRELKTAEGTLNIKTPRVRECSDDFESKILSRFDVLEERIKDLTTEMYVRGLSTRDVEETFTDTDGSKILGRSSVSRLNEKLYKEYEEFNQRSLAGFDVVYLFIDGVYEAIRRYTNNQAILCAWGILSDGTKHLIGLTTVNSESQQAWEMFFEDLLNRGLRQPLLIIADGGKGAKAAIHGAFPKAKRQRCVVHKLRNLMVKLPKEVHIQLLKELKDVYYAPDYEQAKKLAAAIINNYSNQYPSMVKCFCEDLEACLTHLQFPEEHRKFIRTTNLLERAFGEQKRRTKVLPQHEHEKSMCGLVFAVLWRSSKKWMRIPMDDYCLSLLRNLKTIICPEDKDSSHLSYEIAA